MNIQAMMKQAQKLQKEMVEEQNKINEMIFVGESSFVKVEVNGKKEVLKINIEQDNLDSEDIEILQDILVVALNDAFTKIDQETSNKMGKYTQGMPGLF